MTAMASAFSMICSVSVWYQVAIGVVTGITIGAIPGLTASTGMALALPVTLLMPFPQALGLIIGIYKGGTYGGSISAITFATPGTPEAAATVDDGYALMKQGKGRKALEMALYASVTGDAASDIVTIVAAPVLAAVALAFGPAEKAAVVVLAFTLIGILAHDNPLKGILSGAMGIFLGLIGSDPVGMRSRFTFGMYWLSDGIDMVPAMIGVFALSTMLLQLTEESTFRYVVEKGQDLFRRGTEKLKFKEFRGCAKEMGIGIGVGTVVGALPGLGATAGALLSYAAAKRLSKNPEKFGKGALEGIAASESGNNATVGPTLVPLFAFGVPGSVGAALVGGALQLKGLTPSPRIFELHATEMYAMFMILLGANLVNLVIGRLVLPIYARIGRLPRGVLLPVIMVLAVVGTYMYRGNPYDVVTMIALGVLGFAMRLFDYPLSPLVLAFLLTPLLETSLRRALVISRGSLVGAFRSPLSIGLLLITALTVAFSFGFGRKKSKPGDAQSQT